MALALFVAVGATHLHAANYTPFAPNGFTRHSPGRGDRVLRLHRLRRDLDRGGGDAESAAQPADRHPRRPGDLHADLRHRRRRADRHGAVQGARGRRPAGARARAGRLHHGRLDRRARRGRSRCRRCCWCSSTASRASSSRWRATACCRSGRRSSNPVTKVPSTTTMITGLFVALWSLDRRRRRDLRPDEHRHAVRVHARQHRRAGAALQGARSAAAVPRAVRRGRSACCRPPGCLFIMYGLPDTAWERFGRWLVIGLVLYFSYGFSHSKLRATTRAHRRGRPCRPNRGTGPDVTGRRPPLTAFASST